MKRAEPGRLGFTILSAAWALLMGAPGGAPAQQRTPAVELFATASAYHFCNEGPCWWRPEFGAGVLAPLGRRWGVLCDITTSRVAGERLWGFYSNIADTPRGRGDMSFRYSRLSITPSVVRLWRRQRFSLYAGVGSGFWSEWQRHRLRIVAIDGAPGRLLFDGPEQSLVKTGPALLNFRAGLIVNLSARLVLRTGWRYVRVYTDAPGSTALEAGIGYRFPR